MSVAAEGWRVSLAYLRMMGGLMYQRRMGSDLKPMPKHDHRSLSVTLLIDGDKAVLG
jgi:hypothetical protein